MTRKLDDEKQFRQLIIDFHNGKATRKQLAKTIHSHSTSISLESLTTSLQSMFPEAKLTHHETEVRVDLLRATQVSMENAKYELVCLLFDEAETFDSYNNEFFAEHPVTVIHVGGGHYAILDGHHRAKRFAELTEGSRPIPVLMIGTDSLELISRFRREVDHVTEVTGASDIRDLPLT